MAAEPPEPPAEPRPLPVHHHVLRLSRRIGIAIAGGVVVLLGAVMLVTPGPGLFVIALGLAILSLEFERPRVWLAHMKQRFREVADRLRHKTPGDHQP